jgi:predicted NBD/HSP70 family sugar kinase
VAVADLNGELLQKETFPTSPDIDYMNEQILTKVIKYADEHRGHNLEVGISIPGIADQSRNSIIYVPYFQWTDWDIGKQITEKTGLPVIVDNDANAVALAELWFGAEEIRKTRNFILVMIAEGIGTGIIIDGQVYRGENGAAGEFGHMFVAENAPVTCSCGRRDCWEAHASEKAIVYRYQSNNGSAHESGMDFERLMLLAKNGEKHAVEILRETAQYIGIGISNLIIGFSPQAIVVGGSIVRAWDMIKDEIRVLGQRSIRQELSNTMIVPSTLGDSPTILGAISLVLVRKFASAN